MSFLLMLEAKVGRPPVEGFILQESNTSIGSTNGEIQTYFGSLDLANVNQQRNFRFIADANWSSATVTLLQNSHMI